MSYPKSPLESGAENRLSNMADNLSASDRSKAMRAVKARGTKPEKIVFSMLAGLGIRGWKKNAGSVKGKPDVVFPRERLAVFIDGCFWHGCPKCKKPLPQTNMHYWMQKIEKNVQRFRTISRLLRVEGWHVVRIWEHEFKTTTGREKAKATICDALERRR